MPMVWQMKLTPFFSDFPPGQAKNNSMRKMAAKTLMQIMPQELNDQVMNTSINFS